MKRAAPKPQSELSLQMACAGLLDKHLAPPAIFTSFPAGGGGEMRGRILKAAGLKAGFPDLMIMWGGWDQFKIVNPIDPGSGLYLVELKTIRGNLSQAQREMHAAIKATLPGCEIAVCRTIEEFQSQLDTWGVPKRELSKNQQLFAEGAARAAQAYDPICPGCRGAGCLNCDETGLRDCGRGSEEILENG